MKAAEEMKREQKEVKLRMILQDYHRRNDYELQQAVNDILALDALPPAEGAEEILHKYVHTINSDGTSLVTFMGALKAMREFAAQQQPTAEGAEEIVVTDLTQLKNQIEAYAEEVKKSKEQKPEFAGEVLEQSKGGEYKYKMIARPFDKGAFPEDGFIRSENDPNGGFQILTYDRQMPVKEWNKWDLVPLTDIEDIKDKEFIDKDGDYSKITLKWWGNNRGADVSMYDADGNLVEEPFGTSVKDIFTNIEEGYWIEKPAQEAAPGKTPVKEIWQMTKQDFAYSPLRYDGMPTTDGSGVFRAEENPDGTWNAWVESPDGKKDYWSRNASAGEAWDGGKRKTAYMNQEADAKSMDRHKEAVTQALNEGKPVPEEVLRNYIGLKDYLEKQKKKEAAKPKEKESPIPANYREQIDNLKAIALKESTGLDTNRRIAEINALETPTDDETIAYAAEYQCGTPFSERWIGFVKGAKWHRSLHAQKIADKMVSEMLREELIKYDRWMSGNYWGVKQIPTPEQSVDEYLKSRER
jgi:hypothetical protein